MNEIEIAKIVVDAVIEVHRTLGGPGLLEDLTAVRTPTPCGLLQVTLPGHGFLPRDRHRTRACANADFRLGLHGHIHKAQSNLYRYDMSPAGRRLELVCAGTFGAPTRELLPGYPFQYQLLRFEGDTLTVETRRREEINGTWKPDARWTAQRGLDPEPRYRVPL
jgi:hypothetical protein